MTFGATTQTRVAIVVGVSVLLGHALTFIILSLLLYAGGVEPSSGDRPWRGHVARRDV